MRIIIGLSIWLLLLGGGGATLVLHRNDPGLEPGRRLLRFLREEAVSVTVELAGTVDVKAGTHVLIRDPDLFLRRVGSVTRVEGGGEKTRLSLEIYPEHGALLTPDALVTYFTVPGTASWIVNTLIPRDRVQKIQTLWEDFYARERVEIMASLWPAVKESLQEIFRFYEKEIPQVIQNNRPELDALIEKHRRGAYDREFMPAVQDVVWNLARERFAPLLEEVGRDLWQRLPVWGLSWRYMYEYVPFTSEEHVSRRFRDFLDKDAVPLMKSRTRDVVSLLGGIVKDTFRDPRVTASLKILVREVSEDPQVFHMFKKLTSELILKNDRLLVLVRKRWEEKGLKNIVSSVGARFEPLVRDAVNSIVLDEDGKSLHPRLAQVLRSRVLKKDRAWVLMEPGTGPPLGPGSVIQGRING